MPNGHSETAVDFAAHDAHRALAANEALVKRISELERAVTALHTRLFFVEQQIMSLS